MNTPLSLQPLVQQPAPLVRNDALNLFLALPCPMKVPFRQLFTPWLEQFNLNHPDLPLHCPNILACGSQELEDVINAVTTPVHLPDLIITGDFDLLFSSPLGTRFLGRGDFALDVFAYTSWNVVQDLSFHNVYPLFSSWEEILDEKLPPLFSVHGHLDRVTYSLMNFFRLTLGDDAIPQFARKILDIKHFSHIIKRLGANDDRTTPLALLPSAAVAQIPSTKNVHLLSLREGSPLAPLILLHKPDKHKLLAPVMDWLLGQPFSRFLKAYGCIPAGNLALSDTQHFANPPFFIPDLYISKENYLINNQTFNSLYFGNLDNDAIAARSVPGGICR